jgi:hypothetical protein
MFLVSLRTKAVANKIKDPNRDVGQNMRQKNLEKGQIRAFPFF